MLNGRNLNANWRVVITNFVKKQIRRLPRKDVERIEAAIDEMVQNPFYGDITKLGDGNRWRKRVGNYRIMYNLLSDERTIFIYDVRRRTSNTY